MYVLCQLCRFCSVLDKIKSNLRKEQRIVMEMNFAVLNRILSPLQVKHGLIVGIAPQTTHAQSKESCKCTQDSMSILLNTSAQHPLVIVLLRSLKMMITK